MSRNTVRLGALTLILTGVACQAQGAGWEAPVPSPLPFVTIPTDGPAPAQAEAWVIFGTDTVTAEIADTPAARERGLMFRESLPDGRGMLFVFGEEAIRGFWMDNTYIALDIAFLDASYRIVDIQQMEPMTTETHDSRAPFMYALEVPKGWLEAHGIGLGAVARIEIGG